MRDPYYWLYAKCFPELARFHGRQDGERAIQRTWKNRSISIRRRIAYGLFVGAASIVGLVTMHQMLALIPLSSYAVWGRLVGDVIVFAAVPASGIWITRRYVQRSLRRQLIERGVPICVHCGYDLTGNVSGVCPECGTKT